MWRVVIPLVLIGLMLAFLGCNSMPGFKGGMADRSAPRAERMAAGPTAATAAKEAGPEAKGGYRKDIQSGMLTAGSFDDSREPAYYHEFVGGLTDGSAMAALAKQCHSRPIVIQVRDTSGQPIGSATVKLDRGQGGRQLVLRTRTDGRVVLLPSWDNFDPQQTLSVQILPPGGGEAVPRTVRAEEADRALTLSDVRGKLPDRLDLAFVVDCTGSMRDELEYLKVEIKSISEAVARRFPKVRQRYALVVYRDRGDQYVTRVYDFTDSLSTFRRKLGSQSADGGGDYPEAVDEALAKAARLSWDAGNAARIVFHVADAPPHTDRAERALRAVDDLRAHGVAIYPVASSGVADEAEFVMRTEALLTGSRYLFLTDDSGVGHSHAKPHFPRYHVQRLDRLMIRMIASELSGRPVKAEPGDIIRTFDAGQDDRQKRPGAVAVEP